jgi:histidinol-phosphate aminotransferase
VLNKWWLRLARAVSEYIRMHLNESPFSPSPAVRLRVLEYLERLNLYHVRELEERFMKSLSGYTGIPVEYLSVFPGSSEALITILRYCRRKGLKLVTVWPSFHGIAEFANIEGVDLGYAKLVPEYFNLDLVELARKGGPDRALYIVNPNNPTSNMLFEDFETLEFLLRRYGLVIVDEAYYEFSGFTVARGVLEWEKLVVVRTFSKTFSLAGARIGYVIANPEVVRELENLEAAFSTPITSLAAALGALEDLDYVRKVVSEVVLLRDELRELLKSEGLRVLDSKTNFLFIRTPVRGLEVARELAKRGIRVRAYRDPDVEYFIRVSIASRESNKRFFEELRRVLALNSRVVNA